MEGFNDFVDEVTSKDETAVAMKLFYKCSQRELNIIRGVICFVNNDDFVFATTSQTDSRSELLNTGSDGIKETTFIRTVDDNVAQVKFIA